MPMNRALYPPEWEQISLAARDRAGWRCEDCGIARGEWVTGKRGNRYRIVLTVAHVDHDTTNNDPSNLRALCQPCHLRLDQEQHKTNAAATRRRRQRDRGQLDLFATGEPDHSEKERRSHGNEQDNQRDQA